MNINILAVDPGQLNNFATGVNPMPQHCNDPRWMVTKFPSKAKDGANISAGTRAFYFPLSTTLLVGEEAEAAARGFEGECDDDRFIGDRL